MIHIPTEQELTDSDGKEIEYLESAELAELAEAVISKDYSRFHHLEDIAVRYLWRGEGGSSGGKATLGKCEKMSGLKKHFARCDFAVYLSADHCRARRFEERQLEALLFHEMSHIGVEETEKGETKYVILPHDLEFFLAEIPAHGFWNTDLQRLQQLPLFRDTVVIPHVEQHPTMVDGCEQCLQELDAELQRQHAEACEKDGVNPGVMAAMREFRDSTQRNLRREGVEALTISTTIDGKTEGVRITKDAVEALPQGEPHLHRHQEAKYPAALCRNADCTLEPRYPVESAETAVAGVG